MPAFQINDDEREALRGLPMLAREVYVFGIRPFMDYASGIVGVKRRISYQSISEELYVEPHQGIKGGSPTVNELRRAIQWLERAGLVTRDADSNKGQKQLVFQLVFATRDQSVRNKVNSKCTVELNNDLNSAETSNHAGYSGELNSEADRPKTAKVNIPPVSDLPTTTLRAHDDSELTPQRFAMHDDWIPTPKGWKATATRNGIQAESLTAEALGEFRSYWINRPDKHQSQGQWEHSLAQTIKRTHARSNGHDRTTEGPSAHQQRDPARPRSAVDRVKQAIAERQAREAAAVPAGQALDEDDRDVRPPLDGECWRIG